MNRERKFHAWFIDQHGTKPGGRVSDESLRDTAGAGNHARGFSRGSLSERCWSVTDNGRLFRAGVAYGRRERSKTK